MTGQLLLHAALGAPLLGCLGLAAAPRRAADAVAPAVGVAVAGISLAALIGVAVVAVPQGTDRQQAVTDLAWAPALDLRWHLGVDGLSLPFALLTALLVFCCSVYTLRVRPDGGRLRAFVAVVLLVDVGMLGTFLARDLLLFFLFFEVVLVLMWFVIAWWGDPHDRASRTSAATTFLLYTVLGSAVMLVGLLVVHAQTGTFDMVELAARGGEGIGRGAQLVAALAIVGGLAVKVPVWPLHSWLPDAHAKAPTVGSVLLAGVLLKMGSYGLVRVAVPIVPDGVAIMAPVLGGLGVIGIVYGALACLAQRDLKRLVAYSSVGHMGFVVLGVASLTEAGLNGSVFAGVAHGIITGLLFFLAGAIKDRHGTSELAALGGGLYARLPRLGALLTFGAIASLGLPGLAGFWGELLALAGAFRPAELLDRPYFLALLAVALGGLVLTAWYLLDVVRRVCQGDAPGGSEVTGIGDVTPHEVASWGPLVALTLLLGVWPGLVLIVVDPAVQALIAGAGP
ncbi:MAG: NADH-quinone oxidoreductase subunit M [Jiangellaceae bacterium]|nr:NADH-quinone oxidoreductase subunit M [Jiangellaceae bacterium]